MYHAKRARWAIAAMFTANGFAMGAWVPQIPPLMPRHGIDESTLGLVILALGLGAVGAMLFAGRLMSRFGGRAVLAAFSMGLTLTLPALAYAPGLVSLFIAAAAFGAIAGVMDVAMNSGAVKVERLLGRAIMSASHGFWSLGGVIGSLAGSWVLAQWGSQTQAILAALVIAAIVLTALPFLLPDPPVPAEPHEKRDFLPKDLGLWILGLMALLSMIPEGAVVDWAAVYLGQELGADTFGAGLGFAAFAATMAVMRFSGDAIRNRFGAVKTLRVSSLIGAAGLMLAAIAPTSALAVAGFAFAGLGVANMVPVLFSAAGNHHGLPPGQAIATVTMVGYAGILVAPASIGFVAEIAGFRVTYGALALLLVLVAALAGRAHPADGIR